jgi:hypothetical protein
VGSLDEALRSRIGELALALDDDAVMVPGAARCA